MGRDTGTSENQAADRENAAIQAATYKRNSAAVADYNTKLGMISQGKQIGANPYLDSGYLQNQNLVASAATGATNAGTKELLQTQANRTGSNTSSNKATIADLGRQRMRTETDYKAGREAQDYDRGLDWQKFLLGSVLAPTGVDTAMFQGSTQGRSSADTNLANIGIADKQAFASMVGAGLQAAGAVGGGFAGRK